MISSVVYEQILNHMTCKLWANLCQWDGKNEEQLFEKERFIFKQKSMTDAYTLLSQNSMFGVLTMHEAILCRNVHSMGFRLTYSSFFEHEHCFTISDSSKLLYNIIAYNEPQSTSI